MDAAEFEGLGTMQVEDIHWRVMDAVIAVIPASAGAGVRHEVGAFSIDDDFVTRTCVVVPRLTKRRIERLGLIDRGWYEFPESRKFPYTAEQYQDCHEIRAFCSQFVDKARVRRGYQRFKATL